MQAFDKDTTAKILEFWFDTIGPEHWFRSNPGLDDDITRRFLDAFELARSSSDNELLDTPETTLAAILLFDQFSRNMFRGTAHAFATDDRAVNLADGALDRGFDHETSERRRIFFYLPYEHAEDIALQDRAVALISTLGDANYTDYAQRHRDVIAKFGRFPHRNVQIGRLSTPGEMRYLATPGAGF